MRIRKLLWSRKVIDKIACKHQVTIEEVYQVFQSRYQLRRGRGDLYYAYGQTDAGRYLLVVLAHKGEGRCKVVTARDMDDSEKRLYRRGK